MDGTGTRTIDIRCRRANMIIKESPANDSWIYQRSWDSVIVSGVPVSARIALAENALHIPLPYPRIIVLLRGTNNIK